LGKFLQAWCIGSILVLLFTTVQGLLASAGMAMPLIGGSKANHVIWGFVATVIVLFAHTITMFYFIGTGSAIKQEARRIADLVPLYQRTRRFKAQTSGLLTLAPLLLMASSIVGAGVAGGSIRPAVHLWMTVVSVVVNVYTLWKASRVIEENIALMKEANRIVTAREAS
jgi:divalent metal cation (Fe/Co/Zn/Cd) transporter